MIWHLFPSFTLSFLSHLSFLSDLTCGGSESWSPCWSSSWLCSIGVAGFWADETVCCLPRMQAVGPGSELGAVACQRMSWCNASGRVAGTGWGWRLGYGCEAGSHSGVACPWTQACIHLPRVGGGARSERRVAHCWSDVWSRSSWSTRQVLSLVYEKTKYCKMCKYGNWVKYF